MRFLAIIQARSGSTRLPGKVLKDICGKSQLQWVIDRVARSRHVDEVMVATTDQPADVSIIDLCKSFDVPCYAGSQDDVLDRFYQAAKPLNPDYVIRVTADCPCFDPQLLDEAIEELDDASDYLGMLSETFPDGLDLEVIRFSALEEAWRAADLASQREHVTQYIVRNPESFALQDFASKIGGHGNERWTVDEPEDLELVKRIYEHFIEGGNPAFGYQDILDFLDSDPQLREINGDFARNEGLAKSLSEDHVVDLPVKAVGE